MTEALMTSWKRSIISLFTQLLKLTCKAESMSAGIADLLLGQIEDSPAEQVVAPGASCRSQIDDFGDGSAEPPHPIEMVAAALQ
ncbi:hypothetical protein [Haloarcula amylolytica]|uniref:Putative oxidoreductase n=1 Tax=Haloarcula amylolytica JCM 13557 TaxID=1227452 RepID=M0KD22_9EURY|nr:hypothetical protein [Haloarcula amylolytica]EMA17740.1 putative oxidoreductase [Haloarcula amylolytica JCM 13557]